MSILRNLTAITLMTATAAFALLGCQKEQGESQDASSQGKTTTDKVRVGSILSLSGTLAGYGELEKRGFDLAVKHINEADGINGSPLDVLYEDSELDPQKAISAYRKLTAVDKVPIIVGAIGSSVCLALGPIAARDQVVLMSAGSTSPKLSGSSPYFFRVAPSDTLGAARLVDWVIEAGHKSIAILYIENDYGAGQKDVAIKRLAERSLTPAVVEKCTPESSNLRPALERIRSAKPDAVLLLTHAPEAGYFLKQANEIAYKIPVYGGDALSDPSIVRIAGDAAEGVRFLLPAKGSGPLYDRYAQAYRAQYNAEPDAVGLKAYSLMFVAAGALRKASYKGSALKEYLAAMPDVPTAMGDISFDKFGDIKEVRFERLEYRSGKAETVR